MKSEKPQTAERLRAVNQLYFANFGRLTTEALDSNKYLTAADANSCVSSLASKLRYYPPRFKLKDDDFCEWAANVLEASVFIFSLISETKPFVYKSILRVLANCEGLGVNDGTKDEIASDVWMWSLTHIDELLKPGTAKLTTRMSDRARWAARAWKTQQLREKAGYAPVTEVDAVQALHIFGGRQTSVPSVEY